MSNKTICVDSAMFSKVSKRLQEDRSLHETKESLAQAFGFRNLNALQQFFNTPIKKEASFGMEHNYVRQFISLNDEQKKKIFSVLLNEQYDAKIQKLSLHFLYLFIQLCDCEKTDIGSEYLSRFKDLEVFYSWRDSYREKGMKSMYRPTHLTAQLLTDVETYINRLAEQVGHTKYDEVIRLYVEVYCSLLYVLKTFESLQEDNPLLFSVDWMRWCDNDELIASNNDVRQKYAQSNPNIWRIRLNAWSEKKPGDYGFLVYFDERIAFHENIDDTWLNYSLFLDTVIAKFKNCTIDKIYLSDLIFDYAHVANPIKEERLRENIIYFLNNLDTTRKLSLLLQQA